MNQLMVFQYEENNVRTITIDGSPWWVLADVCKVLELSDVSMTARRLDDDEKDILKPVADSHFKDKSDLGLNIPNRGVTIVNESGLYNVILRSDKPQAKAFRRWITHEVLPSIRKTGTYNTDTASVDWTHEQRLRIAGILSKSTKHGMPYVLQILGIEESKAESGSPLTETSVTGRNVTRSVVDFLNFFGNVFGIITKEVYDRYCDYCISQNIETLSHIELSRQICKSLDVAIKNVRVDGKVQRVFTNK